MLATWTMAVYLAYPTGLVLGFDPVDDGAAMAWLRAHAAPGDVVVNDGYADAGIWAPYKADVPVLLPRWMLFSADENARRELVLANIGALDRVPEAAAAACLGHVKFVYYGAKTSEWDKRKFPPVEELRRSVPLEEVFARGNAVVFRSRLNCAP